MRNSIFILLFLFFSINFIFAYDRKAWKFNSKRSPFANDQIGFYTQKKANRTDVDHIVALYDAYLSGGKDWHNSTKVLFANDFENHAPALEYVNRILKRAHTPKIFIEQMKENKSYKFGSDEVICIYIRKYVLIKNKYKLTYDNNDIVFLRKNLGNCKEAGY